MILSVSLEYMELKSNNLLLVNVHCIFTLCHSVWRSHFSFLFVLCYFLFEINCTCLVIFLFSYVLFVFQWLEILYSSFFNLVYWINLSIICSCSSRWIAWKFWNRFTFFHFVILLPCNSLFVSVLITRMFKRLHLYL